MADELRVPFVSSAGGRTFVLTMGCGMVTTLLVWFGKVDGTVYSSVLLGTVGVYIAANAYQKGVETNANKDMAIATGTPPPLPPTNPT